MINLSCRVKHDSKCDAYPFTFKGGLITLPTKQVTSQRARAPGGAIRCKDQFALALIASIGDKVFGHRKEGLEDCLQTAGLLRCQALNLPNQLEHRPQTCSQRT
jgi:hypothetical protein